MGVSEWRVVGIDIGCKWEQNLKVMMHCICLGHQPATPPDCDRCLFEWTEGG